MKRPMDFWKGMCMAQALIYTCYLMYGCFLYGYQGQFTLPLAYQGVSKYAWQVRLDSSSMELIGVED